MTMYLYFCAMTYGFILGFDVGGARSAQPLAAAFWAALWPICWIWVAVKMHRARRAKE